MAAPLRSVENYAGIINVVLFPLLFLSGALYPTAGMPLTLRVVARLNPVSYAVDLTRLALGQPLPPSVAAPDQPSDLWKGAPHPTSTPTTNVREEP